MILSIIGKIHQKWLFETTSTPVSHRPNFGSMFQSSDSTYIFLSLYGVWFIDPKFRHWQGFKKNVKVQDKPADE